MLILFALKLSDGFIYPANRCYNANNCKFMSNIFMLNRVEYDKGCITSRPVTVVISYVRDFSL